MKIIASITLTVMFTLPSLASAQQLLATAERLARETEQQPAEATRQSTGRVVLGLAMVGAGAAMLLIEPKQPTQPSELADSVLINDAAAFIISSNFARLIADRKTTFLCYPNFLQSCEFTGNAYLSGVYDGAIVSAAGVIASATQGERTVYTGRIQAFKKRQPGMMYGGAALAVGGALLAGFWSDVPIVRQTVVSPTTGGLRVSTSVGF